MNEQKTVVIHGYATGIDLSGFRPARGIDAGFSAFKNEVERGEVVAFRWGMRKKAHFFQAINPLFWLRVYRQEKQHADDAKTHATLKTFLDEHQPRTIVCHSMGCRLLMAYLQTHALPHTVKLIVFNQADISSTHFAIPSALEDRMRTGSLRWINLFCPWDPTLMISAFMARSWRAGLRPILSSLIENTLFPLTRLSNLHMSAISDPELPAFIDRYRKSP